MFPCFFHGFSARLLWSMSSALIRRGRVSRGSMTSSMSRMSASEAATVGLPVLTVPMAVGLIRIVWTQEGAPLNVALKGTARLHMLFGALFTVGLLL